MQLEYLGVNEDLDLKMGYLVGGPYHIEGPGDIFEVDPEDGKLLLSENPKMLREVPEEVVFTCEECGKEYKTEKGLAKHMETAHGAGDDD